MWSGQLLLLLAVPPLRPTTPAHSASQRPLRFADLERLYFERSREPGAESALHAAQVRSVLPVRLTSAPLLDGSVVELEENDPYPSPASRWVRDFRLPHSEGGILRQVMDRHHRITDQWWCLYERGERAECWFFAPSPERSEGKLLAEYEIEKVLQPAPGRLVLRVGGAMFRPQGAWWRQGKDFVFTISGSELRLDHVVGRFYFSRGYDLGEIPPLSVSTERLLDDGSRFEKRSVDAVAEAVLKRCGFCDPLDEEEDARTCAKPEEVARCITADPKAVVTFRRRDEPSFIERGGAVPAKKPR